MYKVIRYFTDLQDNAHAYNVGDVYPRNGVVVTGERIAELASNQNRQGVQLIEKITETASETVEEVPADETTEEERKHKHKKRGE